LVSEGNEVLLGIANEQDVRGGDTNSIFFTAKILHDNLPVPSERAQQYFALQQPSQ